VIECESEPGVVVELGRPSFLFLLIVFMLIANKLSFYRLLWHLGMI